MKLEQLLEASSYAISRTIQQIAEMNSEELLLNMDLYKDANILVRSAYLREIISRTFINIVDIVNKLKNVGYLNDDVIISCIQTSGPHMFSDLMEVENKTKINFLSDTVKLAAVKDLGMNLVLIPTPTPEMIKVGLTDEEFIVEYPTEYVRTVKHVFKNNTILMNKWLRYAKNIREMR